MWLSCFTFWHCHCHTWKINLITFVKLHFQPPTCWVELTISLGGRIVGVRVRKIFFFIQIKGLWGWEWDNVGWQLSNIGNKSSMMAIWGWWMGNGQLCKVLIGYFSCSDGPPSCHAACTWPRLGRWGDGLDLVVHQSCFTALLLVIIVKLPSIKVLIFFF